MSDTESAALIAAIREAYRKVESWPENRPDGFMDLLALRNMVPELADRLQAAEAREVEAFDAGVEAAAKYHDGRQKLFLMEEDKAANSPKPFSSFQWKMEASREWAQARNIRTLKRSPPSDAAAGEAKP